MTAPRPSMNGLADRMTRVKHVQIIAASLEPEPTLLSAATGIGASRAANVRRPHPSG